MFATALGIGILLDATIVRALLVPVAGVAVRPVELVAAGVGGAMVRVEPHAAIPEPRRGEPTASWSAPTTE